MRNLKRYLYFSVFFIFNSFDKNFNKFYQKNFFYKKIEESEFIKNYGKKKLPLVLTLLILGYLGYQRVNSDKNKLERNIKAVVGKIFIILKNKNILIEDSLRDDLREDLRHLDRLRVLKIFEKNDYRELIKMTSKSIYLYEALENILEVKNFYEILNNFKNFSEYSKLINNFEFLKNFLPLEKSGSDILKNIAKRFYEKDVKDIKTFLEKIKFSINKIKNEKNRILRISKN